jgi:hypothetical protein
LILNPPLFSSEDKETVLELEGYGQRRRSRYYPDEAQFISSFSRTYLRRPKPGFGKVVTRSEIEEIKDMLDATIICSNRHEESIRTLLRRVARLETLNKLRSHAKVKAASDENVEVLRKMFHLPPIEDVKEDIFAQMHGMLHEYSEEGIDSVELLRRSREE